MRFKLAACVLFFAAVGRPQFLVTATINGTITDSTNAVAPGAAANNEVRATP